MARCETFDTDDPWKYFELTEPLNYWYTYENAQVWGGGSSQMTETYTRRATQSGRWSGLSPTAAAACVAWIKANFMRSCCDVEVTYGAIVGSQDNFTNSAPDISVDNDGPWYTVNASIDETDSLTEAISSGGSPTNPLSQADIKSHIVAASPFSATKPSFRTYFAGEHEDVEES